MKFLLTRHKDGRDPNQDGINMVDLMMWLVIAALLLATAIQGIGYYQKAAYVYQMQSDVSGAGTRVMSQVSMQDGVLDATVVQQGADASNWSKNVLHTTETTGNGKPFIRATHPSVTDTDVIYLFEDCAPYHVGINVVPKGGNAFMTSCGISGSSPTSSASSSASPSATGTSTASPSATATASPTPTPTSTAANFNTFTKTVAFSSTTLKWAGVSSSEDGTKLVGVTGLGSSSGRVFVSTDSGKTWNSNNNPIGNWENVDSSADGSKIIVTGQGIVWASSDYGTTWTQRTTFPTDITGRGIAMSADGNRIIVGEGAVTSKTAWMSNDFGLTWTQSTLPNQEYYGLASSSDGTKLVAGDYLGTTGGLYTSDNSGASWTFHAVPITTSTNSWDSIASSADGSVIVASQFKGDVFVSKDSGATWAKQTALASPGNWYGAFVSNDGSKIYVSASGVSVNGVTNPGYIYTSIDGGANWKQQTGVGSGNWATMDASDNGMQVIEGEVAGSLYVMKFAP